MITRLTRFALLLVLLSLLLSGCTRHMHHRHRPVSMLKRAIMLHHLVHDKFHNGAHDWTFDWAEENADRRTERAGADEPAPPDLVGTWSGETSLLLATGTATGTLELVIEEQNGTLLRGVANWEIVMDASDEPDSEIAGDTEDQTEDGAAEETDSEAMDEANETDAESSAGTAGETEIQAGSYPVLGVIDPADGDLVLIPAMAGLGEYHGRYTEDGLIEIWHLGSGEDATALKATLTRAENQSETTGTP